MNKQSFTLRALPLGIAALALLGGGTALAQAGAAAGGPVAQVAMNTPSTLSARISAGSTRVEMPFELGEISRLNLDVIVPVDGASLRLQAPDGRVVMASGQPGVSFHPGALLPQPAPGGVFELGPLNSPENGRWMLVLEFPAAERSTVALATLRAVSPIQAGIALERNTLLVGEDVSIGMLLTREGVPILGLSPSLSVSPVGGALGPAQTGLDDGNGADGLANDGLYSIDHTFQQPGEYLIRGQAQVPGTSGPVQRSASQRVRVVEASLNNAQLQLNNLLGNGGCVTGLELKMDFAAVRDGRFAARALLSGPDGRSTEAQQAFSASQGRASASLRFSAKELKDKLGPQGPYRVRGIEVLDVGGDDFMLAYRRSEPGSFTLPAAGLCAQPIELPGPLTVTPQLRSGYIDALEMRLPIRVTVSGFYQISYKVFGGKGEDLGLFNASRQLSAGLNQVSLTLSAQQLGQTDGPYSVASLLVLGGGAAERQAQVGSSAPYSRWQYYPRIAGDLNGDGSVDAQDNALITQFRNQRALVPGDRRDLNRDGVINLIDARLLQQRACKAPNCPLQP